LVIERDEDSLEREAPEADPIRTAISALIGVVFELTTVGTAEHKAAMIAVLEAHERIKDALRAGPTLN
jgi:hypothetical protein